MTITIKKILFLICFVIVSTIAILAFLFEMKNNVLTTTAPIITTTIAPTTTTNLPAAQTKPLVNYQKGSVSKIVNIVNEHSPLSQSDLTAKTKLIQNAQDNVIHSAPSYTIIYITATDTFQTDILTTNISSAKQDTVTWLESQGLSINGICKIPVTFYLDRSVAEQLQDSNIKLNPLPDGC